MLSGPGYLVAGKIIKFGLILKCHLDLGLGTSLSWQSPGFTCWKGPGFHTQDGMDLGIMLHTCSPHLGGGDRRIRSSRLRSGTNGVRG